MIKAEWTNEDALDVKPTYSEHKGVELMKLYCPMAGRICDIESREAVWCLTCLHISEEDRDLIKKALGPRKAHWIDTYGEDWICSNCGVETHVDEDYRVDDKRAYQMNYCHYCGAYMVEEEESDGD